MRRIMRRFAGSVASCVASVVIPSWLVSADGILDRVLSPLDPLVADRWHWLPVLAVAWWTVRWFSYRPGLWLAMLRCRLLRRGGERTALYRWFDGSGRLRYVGISNDVRRRTGQHAAGKWWWFEVRSCTVEWFDTRGAALAAERAAIRAERPRHNVVHNGRRRAAA
jgi:predicted GIY-YIG superfamily endonuclease